MADNLSLLNGLKILLLYNNSTPSLAVAEISKKLGYSKSKAYRLIKSLVDCNFLQKKLGTKEYGLGVNSLRLGLIAQQNVKFFEIVRPLMEELSRLTKESVSLAARDRTKIILLEKVESDEPVRHSLASFGEVQPLTSGASSKVLLAYCDEEEWDQIISREGLRRYTPFTITSANQLKKQLREIRKKGYALSDREQIADVRAVAAPIRDINGQVVAALGITGPAYRINKKRVREFAELVVQYADKISHSGLGSVLRFQQ
jgi:IclR family KDG regulon transcriptional repressor